MQMNKSELIKEALEKARINDRFEHWKLLELFDRGAALVTIPVYEDHEHVFDMRFEIVLPKEDKVEQTELF